MQIDRIQYKKVFPISSFCTEHIGLEGSLEENENPEEALLKLKTMVEDLHRETLSHLEEYRGTHEKIINPVDVTIQGIIEDINKCTAVYEKNGLGVQTGLVAYEEAAGKFPEIKAAYDIKMLELTKNQ